MENVEKGGHWPLLRITAVKHKFPVSAGSVRNEE